MSLLTVRMSPAAEKLERTREEADRLTLAIEKIIDVADCPETGPGAKIEAVRAIAALALAEEDLGPDGVCPACGRPDCDTLPPEA